MASKVHECDIKGCDGTKLGHDLAKEFPNATKKFNDSMDRLRNPDDHYKIEIEYCEAYNTRRQGICDAALTPLGDCPYALEHGDHLADV